MGFSAFSTGLPRHMETVPPHSESPWLVEREEKSSVEVLDLSPLTSVFLTSSDSRPSTPQATPRPRPQLQESFRPLLQLLQERTLWACMNENILSSFLLSSSVTHYLCDGLVNSLIYSHRFVVILFPPSHSCCCSVSLLQECTVKRMISGTFPSLPYVCHYDDLRDNLIDDAGKQQKGRGKTCFHLISMQTHIHSTTVAEDI